MAPGDFSFGGFDTTYTSPTIPAFPDNHIGTLQPIQPNPSAGYSGSVHHPQHSPASYPPHPQRTPSDAGLKHDGVGQPNRSMNFEEASRMAAEEDKRRRNTAASARFRIKKKQREQALEKSAKDMTDKVTRLEGRVSTLETENKWLKDMLMEKHDGKIDLDKLWKAFSIAKEKTPPKEQSPRSKSSTAAPLSEPEDSDASSGTKSRSR